MAVIYFFGKFILGYVTCFWGCSLLVPKTYVKWYISWFICVFIIYGRYTGASSVYRNWRDFSVSYCYYHFSIICLYVWNCLFLVTGSLDAIEDWGVAEDRYAVLKR